MQGRFSGFGSEHPQGSGLGSVQGFGFLSGVKNLSNCKIIPATAAQAVTSFDVFSSIVLHFYGF